MNGLRKPDLIFFSVIAGIIIISIVVYLLAPVFNKKKYKEAREQYKAREEAFHKNK